MKSCIPEKTREIIVKKREGRNFSPLLKELRSRVRTGKHALITVFWRLGDAKMALTTVFAREIHRDREDTFSISNYSSWGKPS